MKDISDCSKSRSRHDLQFWFCYTHSYYSEESLFAFSSYFNTTHIISGNSNSASAVVAITSATVTCVVKTSLNIQNSDRANLLKLLEETKIRLADCGCVCVHVSDDGEIWQPHWDLNGNYSSDASRDLYFLVIIAFHYSLNVIKITLSE